MRRWALDCLVNPPYLLMFSSDIGLQSRDTSRPECSRPKNISLFVQNHEERHQKRPSRCCMTYSMLSSFSASAALRAQLSANAPSCSPSSSSPWSESQPTSPTPPHPHGSRNPELSLHVNDRGQTLAHPTLFAHHFGSYLPTGSFRLTPPKLNAKTLA